ncbi:lysine-N-methylase [Paenibacillus barcinonensis]|uniref:Lysine-N-methylase n=1 Tax=Paenibacillus barcinonensis TaxID=198119 RepID=A0A2V4VBN3_PAEBA|nr:flagellin lysine-N-methylase [Paenibacillus barcinonensis]PYE50643.1 lysine-N-methylase [Paenibacillus barcinonensis]QKS57335.1 lysine-N-methylase [Paenibacillus barcinonensis]
MTVKNRTILVPEYMQDFACIGSACEDSCCIGWRVDIDQQTYKKYAKSRNIELKPLFDKNVSRHRSEPTVHRYAKINMDEQGRCGFLSEENLCKIQLGLGEDYLSNVCSSYPRSINSIDGVLEKSTTLSCPEAARLTLLKPEGIQFNEVEEALDNKVWVNKQIITDNPNGKNKLIPYFWNLRIFTIQVLQNRTYTLAERLIVLGLFYQKIQSQVNEENYDAIEDTITLYSSMLEDPDTKNSLMDIPVNNIVQLKLSKELMDYRFGHGIKNGRYMECVIETLNGIMYTEDTSEEEIAERYTAASEEFFAPFMKEHEYILENYLVNYVFKNLFPFGRSQVFDDYVMMVVHFSMIKLHLIGMSGFHKGLTTELVVKLVQSFAKTVEHNSNYLNNVLDLLESNNFKSMAYMSIMIKN